MNNVTVLPLLTAPPQDIEKIMYDELEINKHPSSSSSDTHPITTGSAHIYIAEGSVDNIQQTVEVETENTAKRTTKKGSGRIKTKMEAPTLICKIPLTKLQNPV